MNATTMNRLQKLRKEMQETQDRLHITEYEGRASGVRIVMLGSHQVVELNIDPELLSDIEMLQDAILLAINDAVETVSKKTSEEMSKFTMGMGMGF